MKNKIAWIKTAIELSEIQNQIKILKIKRRDIAKDLKYLSEESGSSFGGYEYKPTSKNTWELTLVEQFKI